MLRHLRALAFLCALANLFTSCAADADVHKFSRAESVAVPRRIELQEEKAVSTVHFPRGSYAIEAEDHRGYYYRAPRPVIKHSFSGFEAFEGGIFLSRNSHTLRGYIVWAGGRTQIGDLSHAKFFFR